MPVSDELISQILYGTTNDLSDEIQRKIEARMRNASKTFESIRANRSSTSNSGKKVESLLDGNTDYFTTIKNVINGDNKMMDSFGGILETLYEKNKKYFSLIKDYETMPILIPQVNRVLMFMVNECISPDVQNEHNFSLKVTVAENVDELQKEVDAIRDEMLLDNLLKDVYENRYKLGREYYIVRDYSKTFKRMEQIIEQKSLNDSVTYINPVDPIDEMVSKLRTKIDDLEVSYSYIGAKNKAITETVSTKDFNLGDLNIIIERSSLASDLDEYRDEILSETYAERSPDRIFDSLLNEDGFNIVDKPLDRDKMLSVVRAVEAKKLRRCGVERLDPARVFRLKLGGKIIGYFYLTDIDDAGNNRNLINFAQSLKDRLLKSKAANIDSANIEAEEMITKALGQKIINAFDPAININRIEDIDLLHDFIINSDLYKGNKKLTFYYSDEIYDLSRSGDSVLTNAVFFVKLYAMLMLNNINTKVLRGKGRQIHTINMGASPNVRRYLEYAMKALTSPETNLGTLNGTFEQLLNALYSSPDIIIPAEENSTPFITTDYIEGQNVDMDNDFLRYLLNSIITSFGLDSAVLDATNGNLNFASTLAMESAQISNMIRCEQAELIGPWSDMVLKICDIMGTDALRQAIDNDEVEVKFFSPKSLIIKTSTDELNNTKGLADSLADTIPEFNTDGVDTTMLRNRFVYDFVRANSNIDWNLVDDILEDAKYAAKEDNIKTQASMMAQGALENMEEKDYDDITEEDLAEPEEGEGEDMNFGGEMGSEEAAPEAGGETGEQENPFEQPPETGTPEQGGEQAAEGQQQQQGQQEDMTNFGPSTDNNFGLPQTGEFPNL